MPQFVNLPRPAWSSHAPGANVAVLVDAAGAATARERSVNFLGEYVTEILARAGVPHAVVDRAALTGDRLPPILVLAHPVRLSAAERDALTRHVSAGGAVIAAAGAEGADELFGVKASRRRVTGAVRWPDGAFGASGGARPAWNAQVAELLDDGGATAIGALEDAGGNALGVAAATRVAGRGATAFIAVDVAASVVSMQQGAPVASDAEPAPDGSAPLNDRILKADDGAVIPWSFREAVAGQLAYVTPFADWWRDVLVGAILECAERVRAVVPVVWFWPRGLEAVAHLSHDTDSNEGRDGWAFMRFLDELGVHGTWCVMFPGGYPRELYDALVAGGHEVALHYDALTTDLNGAAHCEWSEDAFRHQLAWLRDETGVPDVLNQKNHVTRWEGWVELFRWVERAGIPVDSTKGPSKIGNLGFNFGSCHPWRPIDDFAHDNRLMNLFEVPFLSMDMWQTEQRREVRRALLDACVRHHGVAHFLFHPQRIWEDGMRESIADIVNAARERGLEWWTSAEILAWEWARRAARPSARLDADRVTVTLDGVPAGATVLVAGLPRDARVHGAASVRFLGRDWPAFHVGDAPAATLEARVDEVIA